MRILTLALCFCFPEIDDGTSGSFFLASLRHSIRSSILFLLRILRFFFGSATFAYFLFLYLSWRHLFESHLCVVNSYCVSFRHALPAGLMGTHFLF